MPEGLVRRVGDSAGAGEAGPAGGLGDGGGGGCEDEVTLLRPRRGTGGEDQLQEAEIDALGAAAVERDVAGAANSLHQGGMKFGGPPHRQVAGQSQGACIWRH